MINDFATIKLKRETEMENKTPIKSIRAKCLECSNQQKGEVLNCVITDCSLYPFRLGKNPNRKRKESLKKC
jgi:hypothetical protein